MAIRLIPIHQVQVASRDGHWTSSGLDPQFCVEGFGTSWRRWIRCAWRGCSAVPRQLKLYLDRGAGYNERDTIVLGLLDEQMRRGWQFFHLGEAPVVSIRLDVGESPGDFHLDQFHMEATRPSSMNLRLLPAVLQEGWRRRSELIQLPQQVWRQGIRPSYRNLRQDLLSQRGGAAPSTAPVLYQPESHAVILSRTNDLRARIAGWTSRPLISLAVPVYNPQLDHLSACIESVRAQIYPHWQLCLADDASTDPRVLSLLRDWAAKDARISVVSRPNNGHICHATNSALAAATGDYIGFLDNDDLLSPDALFEVAQAISENPSIDYLYSDEDKLDDVSGRRYDPYFKPDWQPDLLLGCMYTGHLSVYRSLLLRDLGGMRPGYEGSQDHDLCLRMAERSVTVHHIPRVLYHWRSHANSTAGAASAKSYADDAGLRAVRDALARRSEGGVSEPIPGAPGRYYTRYPVRGQPLVSILIPTRDGADVLEQCLRSLFELTSWRHFEVLIIDNGSIEKETFDLFRRYSAQYPEKFRVDRQDIPFNFSRLNNLGAKSARGEYILLLNNDTEVIAPTWLEEMLGWAQRPHIGVVGAMLLYPDRSIQHAGVVLGVGGVAGHSHKYLHCDSGGYFGRLLMPAPYTAVTAACLLVRREIYERVGGLDETLEVAFNDVDFCCRVHQLSLTAIVPPRAVLLHHESKSRGAEDNPIKQARFLREAAYMRERWGALLDHDPAYSPHLSRTHEDYRLAGHDLAT